jgi:hypothetical protein
LGYTSSKHSGYSLSPQTPLGKGGLGDRCVAPVDRNGISNAIAPDLAVRFRVIPVLNTQVTVYPPKPSSLKLRFVRGALETGAKREEGLGDRCVAPVDRNGIRTSQEGASSFFVFDLSRVQALHP